MAGAGLLALAACSKEPIDLPSNFTPSYGASWAHSHGKSQTPCRIRIAQVSDKRTVKESMGNLGVRQVRSPDPAAWLKSGLETLGRDPGLQIVDEQSDLDLDVELLKSYMLTITTDKSANVVVRVRYSRNGAALGEQVIRGTRTGWNWSNGSGEAEGAFDDALGDLLNMLDQDVESRCTALRTPESPAPAR